MIRSSDGSPMKERTMSQAASLSSRSSFRARLDPPSGLGGVSLLVALTALGFGCSSSDGDTNPSASGGSSPVGTGGTTSTAGGTTSTGGTTSAAGKASTGGTTSAGGTTSSGGTGGSTSGAGTTSKGGTAGSSGKGSGAGMAGLSGQGGSAGSTSKGGAGGAAGASGGAGTAGANGGTGGAVGSKGCGKMPTLKSSTGTSNFTYNTLTSGGASRRYILRLPENYDNERQHRLILGFHGANGNGGQVAGNPAFFGLYALAEGSAIFVAPDAVDGLWNAQADSTLVDDILKQVTEDLCVDPARILLEGFSQGGAMVRTLACGRPGVFRAAVAHSAGGLTLPSTCMPIAYLGSLGLQESGGKGGGQTSQTDFFAKANGCTIDTLPTAPTGGHVCTDYKGCSAGHPTRWCSFDGPHTAAPTESGKSWMPQEVWTFFSQF
jgi:poly(3-hydroxybutyrate) depolymerase